MIAAYVRGGLKNQYKLKNKIMLCVILCVILIVIVSMAASCNQITDNNGHNTNKSDYIFEKLDEKQLDSYTTDINDRAAYYEKHVEGVMDNMTREESISNYFVNLKVNYSGIDQYEKDDIIFLRNDNVYKGDLYDGDDTISLPPGIYRVISEKIEQEKAILGEIKLLTPHEDVVLNVDYNAACAYISSDKKGK